jgi:hypothetical protein
MGGPDKMKYLLSQRGISNLIKSSGNSFTGLTALKDIR